MANVRMRTVRNFLTLLISFCPPVFAGSITGNLVLPTPYTDTNQLSMFVRAISTTSTGFVQQSVSFPAGSSAGASIPFSISGIVSGQEYQLNYDCDSFSNPESCKNIVPRAYYQDTGQAVLRQENSTTFDGGLDTTGVTLPVLSGNEITGTIFIPSGSAPVDGLR